MGKLQFKRGDTKPTLEDGEPFFDKVKKMFHIGEGFRIGHETIVNVYPGDDLKAILEGITDATAIKPYTVNIYGGVHDGVDSSFTVKEHVHINRIGNPTITSDNATGTLISECGSNPATNSITGKGNIINTVNTTKRIIGNIDYAEELVLLVNIGTQEATEAFTLKNELGSDVVFSSLSPGMLSFANNSLSWGSDNIGIVAYGQGNQANRNIIVAGSGSSNSYLVSFDTHANYDTSEKYTIVLTKYYNQINSASWSDE